MIIRPAVLEDVPRLVELGCAFLRTSPYRLTFAENPEQMAALATLLITGASSVVLVAAHADDLLGMIGLTAVPHFLSGEMMAGEVFFFIDEGARGSLGVRLLRAAERWALGRGAVAMQMIAPVHSPRVEAFYTALAYEPIERTFLRGLP